MLTPENCPRQATIRHLIVAGRASLKHLTFPTKYQVPQNQDNLQHHLTPLTTSIRETKQNALLLHLTQISKSPIIRTPETKLEATKCGNHRSSTWRTCRKLPMGHPPVLQKATTKICSQISTTSSCRRQMSRRSPMLSARRIPLLPRTT